MKNVILLLLSIFVTTSCASISQQTSPQIKHTNSIPIIQHAFLGDNLKTNTTKTSIDLNKILNGGPGKDGIPAINKPKFIATNSVQEKMQYLSADSQGMSVTIKGESKFYPYAILVWHEIVNDSIAGKNIAVTFCPLCGSAIVYNRDISGKTLNFGVSGKLYQSNLLMFDNATESLWSQSLGEAIVGDHLAIKLDVIDTDLLTLGEFKKHFPKGKVLSDQTGYSRNYGVIPYKGYDDSEDLYFPVDNSDKRFHAKDLFYIIHDGKESIAFQLSKLREKKKAEIAVGENLYFAEYNKGIITVKKNAGENLAGYYEMWFSWINGNDEGELWSG